MQKKCGDSHTSKSKLKLGDNIHKKGIEPGIPSATKYCAHSKKKCASPKTGGGIMGLLGELPQPIRTLGPKQLQAMSQYGNSIAVYGITSLVAICYFCEWKAVLQYLPYYNGKYKQDE